MSSATTRELQAVAGIAQAIKAKVGAAARVYVGRGLEIDNDELPAIDVNPGEIKTDLLGVGMRGPKYQHLLTVSVVVLVPGHSHSLIEASAELGPYGEADNLISLISEAASIVPNHPGENFGLPWLASVEQVSRTWGRPDGGPHLLAVPTLYALKFTTSKSNLTE